jgi:hypothetical protein
MKENHETEATRLEAQSSKLGTKQIDLERLRKAIRFLDERTPAIIPPRSNTSAGSDRCEVREATAATMPGRPSSAD